VFLKSLTLKGFKSFADPATLDRFLDGQPLRRPGEPRDIAAAIRYLAGPEANWVTGVHLAVDGGHTLRSFPDLRPGRSIG